MENYIDLTCTPGGGVKMRFSVLGPVTVSDGSASVGIGGPKQRAVLAMLIAGAGTQVSHDAIIEAVWGDDTPGNARRNVQTYVANLRSAIGDRIVKDTHGWRFAVERADVDAMAFEDLFESARAVVDSNPERASVALRDALAMWQGHPYADIEAHGALDGEVARLTELRSAAQAARVEADLALGRDADLVGEIEALLAENPYSERFRSQHMLALYRAGRQQEALRSYGQMRTVLLEELGVEPTPELQQLELRILEQDESLLSVPVQTVSRRTVVVVDPGDPIEVGHLPADERDELLERISMAVRVAVDTEDGVQTVSAGATSYLISESSAQAGRIAQRIVPAPGGHQPRIAIDCGDVVIDEVGVAGAPVSRAAVMAAVAHQGQILISADAQQAIGSESTGDGFRFETLGSHRLHSIDDEVVIYQLVMDGQPTFPALQTHRLPPPLPSADSRSVPGYELREQFGPGSIGVLHRAFQPSVGREVLVEVIGRAQSSSADFVRVFEADAQRLALLDHQNLAAVVDYWRRPDGAFLVYRYPRGGTLAEGRPADAVRVVQGVAAALMYAHSLGMTHGSVRPDRVLLDEAGNASLIGFPIAGVAPRASAEFPAYIAPETIAGRGPSIAGDVYALGMLAHELTTGAPADDRPVEPELPAIARALSEDPESRQTSVAEFLAEMTPVAADAAASRFTDARNPYKGLAAFQERDSDDFFGRGSVVEELIDALGRSKLLAIVGPSGGGKSSVARAGLLPALRSGALPGSESWMITDMIPGSHPFLELQRAFERVAVDVPVGLTESLASRDASALSDTRRLLPDQSELVVLIDQFEELFTLTGDDERSAFLELITASVERDDARFVVTVRADFLDEPLRYSGFGELLKRSTVMLRAPNEEELAEAITGPAGRVGVNVDPVLVERMVTDVHDQPGALPLLQHTLGELFDVRRTDRIGVDTFEEVGGVTGSLARRAESIHGALDPDVRHRVAQVFLRLVAVNEEGPPTRRRVRLTDLADLDAVDAIDAFARVRLVTYDNDPETRSPTVEVSHEALLTHWPRLAGWIDSTREDLALSRRLDEAVTDWEANGRPTSHLLTGGRLAHHEAWIDDTDLQLGPAPREFLDLSRTHDDALRRRRRRIRNIVMAGFAIAAVVASVFALIAVQNARTADEKTELARAEALASSALAVIDEDPELAVLLGIQALETAPDSAPAGIALDSAVQANRTIFTLEAPFEIPPPGNAFGSLSPDGDRIAVSFGHEIQVWEVGSTDGPLWIAEADGDNQYWGATFTTDSRYVIGEPDVHTNVDEELSCQFDTFRIFDADTGRLVDEYVFSNLDGFFSGMAQTGPRVDLSRPLIRGDLGVGCDFPEIGDLVGVDLQSGAQRVLGTGATFSGRFTGVPTISEDGTRLASTGDSEPGAVIDLETGEELMELPTGHSSLSPDGSLVLAGNNPLELWHVDDQEKLREFQGDFSIAWFSPDESMVYGATNDGPVLVYDIESGELLFDLRGHSGGVAELQMSDDESRLATFGWDGAARVWDIGSVWSATAGPSEFDAEADDASAIFGVQNTHVMPDAIAAARLVFDGFTEDGRFTFRFETTVYDSATGQTGNTYPGLLLSISHDGSLGAVQRSGEIVELTDDQADGDGGFFTTIEGFAIVDPRTGDTMVELDGTCEWWFRPAGISDYDMVLGPDCRPNPGPWREASFVGSFSPDDSMFVIAGQSGRTTVWDTSTGEMIWNLGEDDEEIGAGGEGIVEFSPDGSLLVRNSHRFVEVWTTESWEMVAEFELVNAPKAAEFTPDGSELVLVDDNVVIVDTTTWEETARLTGQQGSLLLDLAIDPTGRMAASVGFDSEAWIWDLDSHAVAHRFSFPNLFQGLRNVEWVDEQTLLLGSRPRAVMMTLDPDALLTAAADRVTRSFTDQECATYDIDPCPTLEEIRGW